MQRNQSADTACATICPTFDVLRERVGSLASETVQLRNNQ